MKQVFVVKFIQKELILMQITLAEWKWKSKYLEMV